MLNRVTCAPVLLSETSPPAARPPPSASFSDPRRAVQSSELIRAFRTRDQSPRFPRQPTKNHRRAAMQPNGNGSPSGPDYIENFSMPDVELASKIEAYLAGITVTDHNPAILFSWDSEALEEFVQAANAEPDGHPQWFSQPRGSVSPKSVMSDIISYLAQLGGGRCDHVLLAPNSLIQYGHLQERLQYMQYDEFMQKCMANVTPGRTLARTFALTVPSIDRAVPTQCLPPPPPVRQLFE